MIFAIDENTPSLAAAETLRFGNQLADELVSLHRRSRAMLFARPGWTVADLQACVDAMGEQAPLLFAKSRALAEFLATQYPGALSDEELATLVPYTIEPGRDPQPIVFDPNAEYPGA